MDCKTKKITPLKKVNISTGEIKNIARLARLGITKEEALKYRDDLNSILDYAAMLEEIDTSGTMPLCHLLDIKNIWRDDIPAQREAPLELLDSAPDKEDGFYKVPRILTGD